MPQEIEVSPGVFVTHNLYPKRLIENPDGTNAESAEITVTLDGAVVVPRSIEPPFDEITTFETDSRGVAEAVYLPGETVGSSLIALYDAGAGPFPVESLDIPGYLQRALAVEAVIEGGIETPAGAQDKADAAEALANLYTDTQVLGSVKMADDSAVKVWPITTAEVPPGAAQGVVDGDWMLVFP